MDNKLERIIKNSTFTLIDGNYVYAKVSKVPTKGKHFMISKDNDEITVVTESKNLKFLDIMERNKDNYSLISLNVSIPFYSVGFLAAISGQIAKNGMNILIISTYSKDYVMVRKEHTKKAMATLKGLGLSKTSR